MVNHRAEALFGYDRDALVGQLVETLVPPFRTVHSKLRADTSQAPRHGLWGPTRSSLGYGGTGPSFRWISACPTSRPEMVCVRPCSVAAHGGVHDVGQAPLEAPEGLYLALPGLAFALVVSQSFGDCADLGDRYGVHRQRLSLRFPPGLSWCRVVPPGWTPAVIAIADRSGG